MGLARRSNKYIDETAPWILAKTDEDKPRLKTVMFNLVESIRQIAVLISPIMPETSTKIFTQLNCSSISLQSLETFGDNGIVKVGEGTPLFNRIDEKKMLEEIALEENANLKQEKNESSEKAVKSKCDEKIEGVCIGIEDFQKVNLSVASIIECEPVPKSDKLLKLTLNDGVGTRQVVSGIAEWYSPSDLIGKKIIIVANLKPVKLRGVESNGMILAADCDNGDVKVIFVDDTINDGAKIR